MVERRDYARFPFKTLVKLFGGNLDGDVAAQARIAGPVDLAHAAGSEQTQDFIRTQVCSRSECHIRLILLVLAALLAGGQKLITGAPRG